MCDLNSSELIAALAISLNGAELRRVLGSRSQLIALFRLISLEVESISAFSIYGRSSRGRRSQSIILSCELSLDMLKEGYIEGLALHQAVVLHEVGGDRLS